jgi:uncharacterized protein (TIGR03067 family)
MSATLSAALWLLLTGTPVPAVTPLQQDADLKEELQHLQGTWQIELQEENGDKLSDSDVKARTISFGKNAYFLKKNNVVVQIGLMKKLDLGKSPRGFNALIIQGEKKDDIVQGIYSLDGDTLKICLDTDGNGRPKEFKTGPKSGLTLIVAKRVRHKGEEGDLTGSYVSETTEIDGKKFVADVNIERVGDAYLVTYLKGGGIAFIGVAIRKGDLFCMSWINQGQVGISVYQIEKGFRLVGNYTQLGGPGMLGQETITRKLKEI